MDWKPEVADGATGLRTIVAPAPPIPIKMEEENPPAIKLKYIIYEACPVV